MPSSVTGALGGVDPGKRALMCRRPARRHAIAAGQGILDREVHVGKRLQKSRNHRLGRRTPHDRLPIDLARVLWGKQLIRKIHIVRVVQFVELHSHCRHHRSLPFQRASMRTHVQGYAPVRNKYDRPGASS